MSKSKFILPVWYNKYIAEAHIESRGIWKYLYSCKAQWLAIHASKHKLTRLKYSNYLRGCRSLELLKTQFKNMDLPLALFENVGPGTAVDIHQIYEITGDAEYVAKLLNSYYIGSLSSLGIKNFLKDLKKNKSAYRDSTFG
jgi:hypothetical protein